jgi:hypothetical protein
MTLGSVLSNTHQIQREQLQPDLREVVKGWWES